jgi:hypothetical protein
LFERTYQTDVTRKKSGSTTLNKYAGRKKGEKKTQKDKTMGKQNNNS